MITVANTNDAPTVASPVTDQEATEDAAFNFTLPGGSFLDVDASDSLTYAATLSGGAALPAWLSFNAATQTFSGTPGNADVGAFTVRVTATDGSSASVFDDFTLTANNTNDAPTVALPIADQAATQGAAFSFSLPVGMFVDIDAGDSLTYSATLSSAAALPAWLVFDAATRTFAGTPLNADVGAITVRVKASDSASASAVADFLLTVANVNDAPGLARAIGDQSAAPASRLSFQLPAATFADPDAGDSLRYSATRADGSALPAWLAFDAATRVFSGTPAAADIGSFVVRVIATDNNGASAQGLFGITVAVAPVELPAGETVVASPTPAKPPEPAPVAQAPALAVARAPEPVALLPATPEGGERTDSPALPAFTVETLLLTSVRADIAGADVTVRAERPSDSVLAPAPDTEVKDIIRSPSSQMFHDDTMLRKLEEMKRQMQVLDDSRRTVVASSIAITGGLSIGYVLWLVRGGILMSSMISALPAWQMIDPLPVLAASRATRKGKGQAPGEDPEVERLFDEASKNNATPAPMRTDATGAKTPAASGAKSPQQPPEGQA